MQGRGSNGRHRVRGSCAVWWAALVIGAALPRARAEELGILAGRTFAEDRVVNLYDPGEQSSSTYAWGIEYRERLFRYLDASLAYLNEGHLLGHQRDGGTVQLWAVTPRWRDRLALSIGVGPYLYFDTQQTDAWPWFRNYHGIGEIYTGSLTYYGERWFTRLDLIQVHAPGDVDTRLLMLGVGYQLHGLFARNRAGGEPRPAGWAPDRNEIGVFAGETIDNDVGSDKAANFGVEYRHIVGSHIEWSAAWLSENDALGGHHDGIVAEIWAMDLFLHRRLAAGVGVGPYVSLQHYRVQDGQSAPTVSGMASMTVSWRLTRSLLWRFTWYRVFTEDDEDRDVLTTGLSWVWGS